MSLTRGMKTAAMMIRAAHSCAENAKKQPSGKARLFLYRPVGGPASLSFTFGRMVLSQRLICACGAIV